jgi:acetyl-CoA carboxylase biotin carboxylase subunit
VRLPSGSFVPVKRWELKRLLCTPLPTATALHVRFADEAVCIGDAPSKDSYLNIPRIISAAEITGADAIHPVTDFYQNVQSSLRSVMNMESNSSGPSPAMINAMGDKATAKDTMKKAGVPVIPGSDGLLESMEQGMKLAKEIKYPVIVKATAGGGGKGMRIINNESEFKKAWDDAKRESAAAFGNDGLYLEKFVEEPRHIEIQLVGDQYGKACHLSERDCSIQRRHQKLVEETPSPVVTQELREKMGAAAIKGAMAIKYEGVGTIEFLVDKHGDFYFMEMNTRIQVEHPITEEVTDYDLIKEQIKVAAGVPISGKNYFPNLFSMECRINAEDPANGFRPSPG